MGPSTSVGPVQRDADRRLDRRHLTSDTFATMRYMEIANAIQVALECTIYIAPTDLGLTVSEIVEALGRIGYQRGEIGEALRSLDEQANSDRYLPKTTQVLLHFHERSEPDFRNLDAIDFLWKELRDLRRAEGATGRLPRAVLVARAVANGLPKIEAEAAITLLALLRIFVEKDGTVACSPASAGGESPKDSIARRPPGRSRGDKIETLYPIVKDVIERRTDGRTAQAEPLDAFASAIQTLGYGHMRLWWVQTVNELRSLAPNITPTATCVLAAALVEGALGFVVAHARSSGLRVFGSTDFAGSPRTWKIDDLVKSATTGGDDAVLDAATRAKADQLIVTRQRIHAGRMLVDFPSGVPDLRPEEARAAVDTASAVARRVLDWLGRHPVAP